MSRKTPSVVKHRDITVSTGAGAQQRVLVK
ncbi:uncharacterized protein METZ01_LOCUS329590 [marine metagenome]|uniref:Uncharacterized protein n=1 Tax=marine metagenome TaxID=408172 RepID=A0A382PU16_9ZZZZ